MGFTPTFDTAEPASLPLVEEVAPSHFTPSRFTPTIARPRTVMRFGGLTMDSVTGAIQWRGRTLSLPLVERETLGVLLRRGGQIVSPSSLANALGERVDALDGRIERLKAALKHAGATCLPCRVDGLGYVLWRC